MTSTKTEDSVYLAQPAPARTPEFGRSNAWLGVGLLALVLLIAGVLAGAWGYRLWLSNSADRGLVPTAFLTCVLLLVAGIGVLLVTARERRLYNEEEWKCDQDCQELEAALEGITDATLKGLAKSNFKQMRMFTTVAIRQSRIAFYTSVGASLASLMVLLTGAAVATRATETDTQIVAGALTAVGAALSAFIVSVFIRSYSMAASQMSYYYGQPLVHCYLLHAEWLARSAPDTDQQSELLKQVVNASVRASQNAQHHLLQLQVDTRRAPRWVKRVAVDTDTTAVPATLGKPR